MGDNQQVFSSFFELPNGLADSRPKALKALSPFEVGVERIVHPSLEKFGVALFDLFSGQPFKDSVVELFEPGIVVHGNFSVASDRLGYNSTAGERRANDSRKGEREKIGESALELPFPNPVDGDVSPPLIAGLSIVRSLWMAEEEEKGRLLLF